MSTTSYHARSLRWSAIVLLILACSVVSPAQTPAPGQANNEYQIGAVLWQQASGEPVVEIRTGWAALVYHLIESKA